MDIRIETTGEIEVERDAVWEVFGERFGDISTWFSGVLASSVDGELKVGTNRTCELESGTLEERLTHFDRATRSLTYQVTSGLPSMMGTVENAWTFEAIGDGRTRVRSVVSASLAWYATPMVPMIKKNLGRTIRGLIEELGAAAAGRDQAA